MAFLAVFVPLAISPPEAGPREVMSQPRRRRIGQEKFGFVVERDKPSSLDKLVKLIDW